MSISFAQALLVFGILLAATSILSGWIRETVFSVSALALVAGIGLAQIGVLQVSPSSDYLIELIELALILTLLSDGMRVEQAHISKNWALQRERSSSVCP